MNACEAVKDSLCEWLDGELPEAQRASLEAHLHGCPNCREELDALRAASRAVAELPRHAAPATLLQGVRAGIRKGHAPRQQQDAAPRLLQPGERLRPARPGLPWRTGVLSAAAFLTLGVLVYAAFAPHFAHKEFESSYVPGAKAPEAASTGAATPQPARPPASDTAHKNEKLYKGELQDQGRLSAPAAEQEGRRARPAEEVSKAANDKLEGYYERKKILRDDEEKNNLAAAHADAPSPAKRAAVAATPPKPSAAPERAEEALTSRAARKPQTEEADRPGAGWGGGGGMEGGIDAPAGTDAFNKQPPASAASPAPPAQAKKGMDPKAGGKLSDTKAEFKSGAAPHDKQDAAAPAQEAKQALAQEKAAQAGERAPGVASGKPFKFEEKPQAPRRTEAEADKDRTEFAQTRAKFAEEGNRPAAGRHEAEPAAQTPKPAAAQAGPGSGPAAPGGQGGKKELERAPERLALVIRVPAERLEELKVNLKRLAQTGGGSLEPATQALAAKRGPGLAGEGEKIEAERRKDEALDKSRGEASPEPAKQEAKAPAAKAGAALPRVQRIWIRVPAARREQVVAALQVLRNSEDARMARARADRVYGDLAAKEELARKKERAPAEKGEVSALEAGDGEAKSNEPFLGNASTAPTAAPPAAAPAAPSLSQPKDDPQGLVLPVERAPQASREEAARQEAWVTIEVEIEIESGR